MKRNSQIDKLKGLYGDDIVFTTRENDQGMREWITHNLDGLRNLQRREEVQLLESLDKAKIEVKRREEGGYGSDGMREFVEAVEETLHEHLHLRAQLYLQNAPYPGAYVHPPPAQSLTEQQHISKMLTQLKGNAEPADSTTPDEYICNICFENKLQIAVIPCGHLAMCIDCARDILKKRLNILLTGSQNPEIDCVSCPSCRGEIEKLQKIIIP